MSYSSTFRVGRYTCTMTFDPKIFRPCCAWSARVPLAKSLSNNEIGQHRAGRDALMAEVA
jgi:hypothetical protein